MLEHKTDVPMQNELTQLHAATCLLMTRFINGRHCPKLAHLIVHQLGHLLAHPDWNSFPTVERCINNCWNIGKK